MLRLALAATLALSTGSCAGKSRVMYAAPEVPVADVAADEPAPATPVALVAAPPAAPPPAPPREEAPRARMPRPVVAIFDVQDATRQLDAALLDQLTEYLAAQLVEVARFRVVPRNQLRSQLAAEKAGTYDACFEESCQIELGKAVAAEKSLATKLLRVGDACAMTATLYDLRSETTETAASGEGECSANALMGNAKTLAANLADR